MRIVKTHPVICKHQWNLGTWPIHDPKNPIHLVQMQGYHCQRCQTLWKVENKNGVISPKGDEPRIEIGICEIEIPTLKEEPPRAKS